MANPSLVELNSAFLQARNYIRLETKVKDAFGEIRV